MPNWNQSVSSFERLSELSDRLRDDLEVEVESALSLLPDLIVAAVQARPSCLIGKFQILEYIDLYSDRNYILERSRTVEDLSQGPQYKGIFLSESKYVFEEAAPRVGIMLCRVFQMARDGNGNRYRWRSRKKRPDELHKSSSLRFDALLER